MCEVSIKCCSNALTYHSQVTPCGSGKGLSPVRRQEITWTFRWRNAFANVLFKLSPSFSLSPHVYISLQVSFYVCTHPMRDDVATSSLIGWTHSQIDPCTVPYNYVFIQCTNSILSLGKLRNVYLKPIRWFAEIQIIPWPNVMKCQIWKTSWYIAKRCGF